MADRVFLHGTQVVPLALNDVETLVRRPGDIGSVGPDMTGLYIAAIVGARHASPIVRVGFEIAGTPYSWLACGSAVSGSSQPEGWLAAKNG
jgi:hypothetical protein